jgi:hypothetical protein
MQSELQPSIAGSPTRHKRFNGLIQTDLQITSESATCNDHGLRVVSCMAQTARRW